MARDDTPSTKPLVDKLGVKEGQRVAVVGLDDPAFVEQLLERGADVRVGRRRTGADLMVVGVERRQDLPRLRTHRQFIARDGAIWVVWPKGSRDVNENDVRDAALEAGLVDVKVVSFSPTHSGLKLVFRLRDR
jgi:Protein of unknown function (DUF3052)